MIIGHCYMLAIVALPFAFAFWSPNIPRLSPICTPIALRGAFEFRSRAPGFTEVKEQERRRYQCVGTVVRAGARSRDDIEHHDKHMQRDEDTHDRDDTATYGYWSKADGKYKLRTPLTSMVYGEGWLSTTDEVAEPKHQSTGPARQEVEETPNKMLERL